MRLSTTDRLAIVFTVIVVGLTVYEFMVAASKTVDLTQSELMTPIGNR